MRVFEYDAVVGRQDNDDGNVHDIKGIVRFELSEDVYLDVLPSRGYDNSVTVRLSSHRGSAGLKVIPEVGNVIRIKQDEDD